MASGRGGALRDRVGELLTGPERFDLLHPIGDVDVLLPVEVGDYVDFYSSIHHATNLGRILRPDAEPLLPNWRHLPVGYHGRAGTVVVSGTDIVRPAGLVPDPGDGRPRLTPTRALDIELEVGFLVGGPHVDAHRRPTTPTGTCSAPCCSTTGRPATSRPSSTSRSGRTSARASPRRSRRGS